MGDFSVAYSSGGSGGGASGQINQISGLQHIVPGVASAPGWTVVGSDYYIAGKIALEAILLPSNNALTCQVRLFDTVANAAVAGSTLTVGPGVAVDTRVISGDLSAAMPANRIYQIQCQCVGGAAQADFCAVQSAEIVETP